MAARDKILDAAAKVMHERGLAATTTKEIARAAGYSEATLYKHFTDKQEIFVSVLRERLPQLAQVSDLVGTGTVTENLEQIVGQLIRFYIGSFPIAASIFSQPALLASHRSSLADRGAGPRAPVQQVADYLAAEQAAGRVSQQLDVAAVAGLLAGAAFQQGFFANFEATTGPDGVDAWARRLVAAVDLHV